MSQQLFNPGRLVATPGALKLGECGANLISCLIRHLSGDWGDLSSEDKAENDFSLRRDFTHFLCLRYSERTLMDYYRSG